MTGKLSSLPLHNNIVLNFNDNGKELKEILKEHILLYIKENRCDIKNVKC